MDSKNWLRSYVIQVIPLISLVIYVLGFSYYLAYYGILGINIISYITLSEVLISSFVLVIICSIFVFLFYSIFEVYFQRSIKELDRKIPQKPLHKISIVLRRLLSKIQSKSLRKRLGGYICTVVASNAMLIWLIYKTNLGDINNRVLLLPVILAYVSCMVDIYRHYRLLPIYRIRNFYYTITCCIIVIGLIASLIVLGIRDGNSITIEEPDFFELSLSNDQKLNFKQYSYIGDTASTIFLYDRQNSKSVIINREHVISISLNQATIYNRYCIL